MNIKQLIALYLGVHISFILLQIYKHSALVKVMYQKQEYEKQIETLSQKKDAHTQTLYALKNKTNIQKYAQQKLNMQSISLRQIKTVKQHESTL